MKANKRILKIIHSQVLKHLQDEQPAVAISAKFSNVIQYDSTNVNTYL